MSTVTAKLDPVHEILWARPYAPWALLPLAAYLCVEDYPDEGRNAIVDRLKAGASVAELVADGSIEPDHAEACAAALAEGRTEGWMGRYRDRGYRLPAICGGSDEADETIDRSVPPAAVLYPPELEVLAEILDELVVFDPDDFDPAGPDWTREPIAEPSAGPCPCEAEAGEPCKCADDPRVPDAPDFRPMPPIAGGCEDDALWCLEPTAAEWDALEIASRDYPPSGSWD